MGDPDPVKLPAAVAALLADLAARGCEAHVVGPAVGELLAGAPARDFEVAVSTDGPTLLSWFPTAVPLDGSRGRILLPSAAGPVDLVPYAHGGGVHGELGHRDFTIHALALDAAGRVLDPFGGRADAAASRLRCVGRAADRLAEDPLRGLRAVRLVATRGLSPDAELCGALEAACAALAAQPASRVRAELHALLLGPYVGRGLAWLRASGLEAALAQGVGEDAARVVDALPRDLELRLAGWLRGARAVRALRRLREPRARVVAIERLLHLHPIDRVARPGREERLLRRAAPLVPGLLALREAEIEVRAEGAPARARVARLRRLLEDARGSSARPRDALALDGRAVMEILRCEPGPEVGRALRQLEKDVLADPSCNTRERLRERLLAWRAARARSPLSR